MDPLSRARSCLLLLFVAVFCGGADDERVPAPVPDDGTLEASGAVIGTTANHAESLLTPYRGKVVVLDFWASWCGPCAESFPWMESMVRQHGAAGLVVVAVNLDEDPEAARRFLGGKYADFKHVDDPKGAIAEAHGVAVMPTSILYDREGRPSFVHTGFDAEQRSQYEEHIVALLEGKVTGTTMLIARHKRRLGVHPWQRGVLARDDMRLDFDPMDLATDDHIYFSKEASSGGRGFGGGGCGCN